MHNVFAEDYSFRSFGQITITALLGCCTLVCLYLEAYCVYVYVLTANEVGVAVFANLVLIPLGFGAAWLTYRFLRPIIESTSIRIVLSDERIVIGKVAIPWNEVVWIGGRRLLPFFPYYFLTFGRCWEVGFHIPLNRMLNSSEFFQLMNELDRAISTKHSHVEIGHIRRFGRKLLFFSPDTLM